MDEYKKKDFTILSNTPLSRRTMQMDLAGDTSDLTAAGQFVNISVHGKFLRRPISVCDYSDGKMRLLYDVVGDGTRIMAEMQPGEKLDILSGLGNGFSENVPYRKVVLLGGGIGCAPLLNLARKLRLAGKDVTVILGFNTAADIVMAEMFTNLGVRFLIATVDGSEGTRGFVTDAIRENNVDAEYFYACGPMPMLKAVCLGLDIPGEVSLEARMACGFGACVCCSIETAVGYKRICKEGPVFPKEELLWK